MKETVSLQVENNSKEKEIIENNLSGNYGVKSIIIKMKNSLEGLNSKFELAEEIIGWLEDRVIEVMQSGKEREKRTKKNEQNLWEMWALLSMPM